MKQNEQFRDKIIATSSLSNPRKFKLVHAILASVASPSKEVRMLEGEIDSVALQHQQKPMPVGKRFFVRYDSHLNKCWRFVPTCCIERTGQNSYRVAKRKQGQRCSDSSGVASGFCCGNSVAASVFTDSYGQWFQEAKSKVLQVLWLVIAWARRWNLFFCRCNEVKWWIGCTVHLKRRQTAAGTFQCNR